MREKEEGSAEGKEEVRVLKSWDEARALWAKHLVPVGYGPRKQPIYKLEDMEKLCKKLKIKLPD